MPRDVVKRFGKVGVIAAFVVVFMIAGSVALMKYVLFRNACDRFDTVLAKGSEGRSVVYRYEACTTIGTTIRASVDIVSSAGRHETIFAFDPAYGLVSYRGIPVTGPLDPSASWVSEHALTVSIGTVAEVLNQQSDIQGVHVTYNIRQNLHLK